MRLWPTNQLCEREALFLFKGWFNNKMEIVQSLVETDLDSTCSFIPTQFDILQLFLVFVIV